jgi:site-specific DNA-methyltransferase (adenine-specific)
MDVSKAIDKAAGAEREEVGRYRVGGNALTPTSAKGGTYGVGVPNSPPGDLPITAPATPAARQWDGWGTALKPAWEPVIVARKPLIGTVAANVLEYGTGAMNIDGCRVGGVVPQVTQGGQRSRGGIMNATGGERGTPSRPHTLGRWPANLILTYAEDEYMLRHDVTTEQQRELYAWLAENA